MTLAKFTLFLTVVWSSLYKQLCKLSGIPYVQSQWGVPSGVAPSGTMGNNGALTLGTALPTTYSSGIWLHFPAGAISAGSAAGLYWCVMSSATAGTVYNVTLGAAIPYVPSNPAAFVTTGPGAFVGTTSEITLASLTFPGGSLGNNGALIQYVDWSNSNSVNTKLLGHYFGASKWFSPSRTTGTVDSLVHKVQNRGVTNAQSARANYSNASQSSGAFYLSVDTSIDQNIKFTGQTTVATDFVILGGGTLVIYPSA